MAQVGEKGIHREILSQNCPSYGPFEGRRKEIFLDFLTVFAAESEREGKSGGVEVKNGAAANRGGEEGG